eukprot:s14_g37.t1
MATWHSGATVGPGVSESRASAASWEATDHRCTEGKNDEFCMTSFHPVDGSRILRPGAAGTGASAAQPAAFQSFERHRMMSWKSADPSRCWGGRSTASQSGTAGTVFLNRAVVISRTWSSRLTESPSGKLVAPVIEANGTTHFDGTKDRHYKKNMSYSHRYESWLKACFAWRISGDHDDPIANQLLAIAAVGAGQPPAAKSPTHHPCQAAAETPCSWRR